MITVKHQLFDGFSAKIRLAIVKIALYLSYQPQQGSNQLLPKMKSDFNNTINKYDQHDRPRANEEIIKTYKIRVIDHNGNNLGVITSREALYKAKEVALDLVEVSPNTTPPVCKIMDLGKYIFDKKKKDKGNEHRAPETHEIRLSPSIGQNDLEVKARKAEEFLKEGSKVIIQFKLHGREAKKTNLIDDVVKKFHSLLNTISNLENAGGVYILVPKPV